MNNQKNTVLNMSAALLEIPFNTIYSYADNLFDLNELPFNDEVLKDQIHFLSNTKLSDIEYSNTNDTAFFTMTNRMTGEQIQVSNRTSSRGELRGNKLRDLLEQKKQETPNETAYDTITRAIRTTDYSDTVTMFKSTVTNQDLANDNETPMSEEHCDLFIAVLLAKIQEKIHNNQLKDNLEPKEIREKTSVREAILNGIDTGSIYDATHALTVLLKQLQETSDALLRRGYPEAQKAALALYLALTANKKALIQGKLSVQAFHQSCSGLIKQAQQGELQNHRGFFGIIWHAIQVALNTLTFGAVTITTTKSIKETMKMQASIEHVVRSYEGSDTSSNTSPSASTRVTSPQNDADDDTDDNSSAPTKVY